MIAGSRHLRLISGIRCSAVSPEVACAPPDGRMPRG
jgi:hypothetical protein